MPMYERFTDRARKILRLANEEAKRRNDCYIGTEHILLGLIMEGSGVAANVLNNLDIDLRKIRLEIEKIIRSGPEITTAGKLPQPPLAKKVIEYAMEESKTFGHNYVGSEHILLGLLRVQEGIAAIALTNCGVRLEASRLQIFSLLGPAASAPADHGVLGTIEEHKGPAANPPGVCPHCGRPYRSGWPLSPMKLLRRLFRR